MKRPLVLVVAASIGALLGAGTTIAAQDRGSPPSTASPSPSPSPSPSSSSSTLPRPPEASRQLLLAWTAGGLPPGLEAAASATAGVTDVVVVRGDPLALTGVAAGGRTRATPPPPAGWIVSLDAIAIDPAAYQALTPPPDRAAIAGLAAGGAVVGATAATVHEIVPGSELAFGELRVVVSATVPDEAIGGAELAVDVATGERLGVATPRALLIVHAGDRAGIEAALSAAAPEATPIRFRVPGETPFLRAGDAVLPQSLIEASFGAFAFRVPDPASRDIEIDPAWVEANIVTADVPILGRVRCHAGVIAALLGAMTELQEKNLGGTIAAGGYDGCWVPRLVGPGGALSRHAWGVAIDLNYAENPTGTTTLQDPRLVEIMERWGFGWGGNWLVPDPAHFEYVRPVTAPTGEP